MKTRTELEDEAAMIVAKEIKKKAEEEVAQYIASDEFRMMVEAMKRREREKIVTEVQQQIEEEKISMMKVEREKVQAEHQAKLDADQILHLNKLKMEEQQMKAFEQKQKQDAERLAAIQAKQKLEMEKEQQLQLEKERLAKEHEEQLAAAQAARSTGSGEKSEPQKLFFGFAKKKNSLF